MTAPAQTERSSSKVEVQELRDALEREWRAVREQAGLGVPAEIAEAFRQGVRAGTLADGTAGHAIRGAYLLGFDYGVRGKVRLQKG